MSRPTDQCTRCLQMGHRASQCKQPTADARAHLRPGVRNDGIRTLADLRGRCRVDSITACWLWVGALNDDGWPVARFPAGVLRESACVMNPRRAGWLLAGNSLESGQMVMRCCDEPMCVNPEHAKTGTRGDVNRQAGKRGSYSTPERLAHLTRARLKQAATLDQVGAAEQAFEAGASLEDAAKAAGLHPDTVRRIRDGSHIRQTGGALPSSSVFVWRPA